MPQIIPIKELFESTRRKWELHNDIALSEEQIKEGKTKDARVALTGIREKAIPSILSESTTIWKTTGKRYPNDEK